MKRKNLEIHMPNHPKTRSPPPPCVGVDVNHTNQIKKKTLDEELNKIR